MSWIPSASQTVGPFFNFALTRDASLGVLAREGAIGEHVRLKFCVRDGNGEAASTDAMIEIWQADSLGHYGEADPNFYGFGRLQTDEAGTCTFTTVKPGAVNAQAPHINVTLFARGLMRHLHTRLYFAGEPLNESDPVLALVPEARRAGLLARQVADTWCFDIHLQGEQETVFFEL